MQDRSDLPFVGLAGVLAVLFDGNLAYAAAVPLAVYWVVQSLKRLAPGVGST